MHFLFTRFPLASSRTGGGEAQTIAVMEGLARRGHDVRFLGSCRALLSLCAERGIAAESLDIGPPPVTKTGAVSFTWRRFGMRRKILDALAALPPLDAVVMLSLTEKLLVTGDVHQRGARTFWLEHDPVGPWLTRNPWLPMLRRAGKDATIITVSDLNRGIVTRMGFDPARVIAIPNGIDTARFAPGTGKREKGVFRIGAVARLAREKGIDVLLAALVSVPDATLTIIGRGPEEEALRRQIRMLHLDERVRIMPSDDDLPAFYRSLDTFVLPSRTNDPFGLVAAEALCSGTATIVTDACGIAGYLQQGEDALVVPADDAGVLGNALRSLADDAALRARLGTQGRAAVLRLFARETMIERYDDLLKGKF